MFVHHGARTSHWWAPILKISCENMSSQKMPNIGNSTSKLILVACTPKYIPH